MKLSEMTLEQLHDRLRQVNRWIRKREEERLAAPAPVPETLKAWNPEWNRGLSRLEGDVVLDEEFSVLNTYSPCATANTTWLVVIRSGQEYWLHASVDGESRCQIRLLGTPHVDRLDFSNEEDCLDTSHADMLDQFCKEYFGVGVDEATLVHQ